jgi:hypothetical protein
MKHALGILLVLLALTLSACGSTSHPATAPTQVTISHYTATLSALNATHVTGKADFRVTGKVLIVTITATGLEPNKEHYLHIHGAADTQVTCPTPADADPNGHITIDKALTIIGPIALDLQPYPQPDAQGNISWSQTFHLDGYNVSDILPLTHHVIVLHGMTYQGIYDRALTVACGPIEAA